MQSRILIVEDSATQAEALRTLLEEKQYITTVVRSGEEALERLDSDEFDLVLSDVVMPGIDGYELCRRIKADGNTELPVILLTTLGDPLSVVRGMECGADNYITKPWEGPLLLARVSHALHGRAARGGKAPRAKMGVRVAFLGRDFLITAEKEQVLDMFLSSVEDVIRANGALEQSQRALADAHAQLKQYASQMSVQARVSTEKYWTLMRHARDMIFVLDAAGRVIEANERTVELLGIPLGTLRGQPLAAYVAPDARDDFRGRLATLAALGRVEVANLQLTGATNPRLYCDFSASLAPGETGELALAILHDVTERQRLEEQLRQAQKMEAVGQLAGGVAHDFNNLLTVITSYSEMLLENLDPATPGRGDLEEIKHAATRAAGLTRQLLAFSRKQVLQPRVLDLNVDVITGLEKMLRRLIGEDIDLVTTLEPDLGLVNADPGLLEQVIVNLAVNARDAMPNGGRLVIETANAELGADDAGRHIGAQPGRYVMLAASDTGTGMSPETMARMFEPFFTTKEQGKGTGLGLATVHGIVKQSGGDIWVYSEPGQGTTFKVYLPRVEAGVTEAASVSPRQLEHGGGETILLVEDEDAVRSLATKILVSRGYTVLGARNGQEALALCERPEPRIDLVLTDAVMPGMSGRALAERLAALRPAARVLLMSGYTDDDMLRRGILDPRMAFLQKPFTPGALAKKVREVLDTPSGISAPSLPTPGSRTPSRT